MKIIMMYFENPSKNLLCKDDEMHIWHIAKQRKIIILKYPQ